MQYSQSKEPKKVDAKFRILNDLMKCWCNNEISPCQRCEMNGEMCNMHILFEKTYMPIYAKFMLEGKA